MRSQLGLEFARSFLFTPANDERKVVKALQSDADAVIADLEDAVPPTEKETARQVVRRAFASHSTHCIRVIRVNAVDSRFFAEDIAFIRQFDIDAIVVPKATEGAITHMPAGTPLIALVETAEGVQQSAVIARADHVIGLALGSIDLAAELGIEPRPDGQELLYARSKLVIDSAAARIRAPIDSVFVRLKEVRGFEAEARLARSLGMGAKFCIHPDQVAIVNRVFEPRDKEVRAARDLVAAFERSVQEGHGVFALDGVMVDEASLRRARRLLGSLREPRQ